MEELNVICQHYAGDTEKAWMILGFVDNFLLISFDDMLLFDNVKAVKCSHHSHNLKPHVADKY